MAQHRSSDGSDEQRFYDGCGDETRGAAPFEKPLSPPIEIPANMVSDEALEGLIESFILREGTDYGANEVTLTTKKRQVHKQIEAAEVRIIFDPDSESVTLLTASEWAKLAQQYGVR